MAAPSSPLYAHALRRHATHLFIRSTTVVPSGNVIYSRYVRFSRPSPQLRIRLVDVLREYNCLTGGCPVPAFRSVVFIVYAFWEFTFCFCLRFVTIVIVFCLRFGSIFSRSRVLFDSFDFMPRLSIDFRISVQFQLRYGFGFAADCLRLFNLTLIGCFRALFGRHDVRNAGIEEAALVTQIYGPPEASRRPPRAPAPVVPWFDCYSLVNTTLQQVRYTVL